MSERRNLEWVTKTGRGAIHTPHNSREYQEGWERTFGRSVQVCPGCKSLFPVGGEHSCPGYSSRPVEG